MKRKLDHGGDAAERLALDALAWLAADPERLQPFVSASGLTPDTLRASARDLGFLGAVLDHVTGDEAVLLACAEGLGVPPERIAAAWHRLGPPPFDDGI